MTVSVEAQRGQGKRGQSQNNMQGQGMMPKFNAKNAAGILTYNYERVIKKTKLKKDEKKSRVEDIISEYNHSIDEIKILHSDEFRATEKFVAKKYNEAKVGGNREDIRFIQLEAVEKLAHIKSTVLKAELELNGKLEIVFSEKQYKKWLRYQRSKKQSLKQKTPETAGGGRSRQGSPRAR